MSIELTDITQEQYDTAEAVLVSLLRAAYPSLDLRRGTVLRDLLLRPAATTVARDEALMEELRQKQSLVALAESGSTVSPDDVNAILSNFNMERYGGAYAAGQVKVHVAQDRAYTLGAESGFTSLAGAQYLTLATVTVRSTPDTLAGEQQLHQSEDGTYFYFFVEVRAALPGAAYTLQAGDALDTSSSLYGFVTASAYSDFTAGFDDETIQEAITRIPAALSQRALESRTSIEAKLRDQFGGASFRIQELAVQGYGDPAQLRDKHNPMGFAVGSRVDIYAKTFTEPVRHVLQKTGTRIAPNTYQINLMPSEAPGFYAIRSVSEIELSVAPAVGFGELPTHGSYAFEDVRTPYGVQDTFHDIDAAVTAEIAFSNWQQATIVVTGVPHSEASREFKVEAYVAPGLADIQAYIDSTPVRNLEADYIVRCPLICLVEMEARVYYDRAHPLDVAQMQRHLANLVNSRPFGHILTRSELVNQMLSDGATRVDLGVTTGMKLRGYLRDGKGVLHRLETDALDIKLIEDASALLVPDTVVYGVELDNIVIQTTPDA
jgi:hypothetical protein